MIKLLAGLWCFANRASS